MSQLKTLLEYLPIHLAYDRMTHKFGQIKPDITNPSNQVVTKNIANKISQRKLEHAYSTAAKVVM